MGSLAGCLKRLNIAGAEADLIRAKVQEYRDDGVPGTDANIKAVEELIQEARAERTRILGLLPKALQDKLTTGEVSDGQTNIPESVRANTQTEPASQQPETLPGTSTDKGAAPVSSERSGDGRDTDVATSRDGAQSRHGEGDRQPTPRPKPSPSSSATGTEPRQGGSRVTPDSKQSAVEQGIVQPSVIEPNPARAALLDYHIQEHDQLEEGGKKTKYRRNVDAIRLLKQLESEGRLATPEEQATLVRYTGWGGVAEAFRWSRDWDSEYQELQDLLTEQEYRAARESTPFAHYTSPDVITGIWAGLKRLGFTRGRILEPGAGIGHFFGLMPKESVKGSSRTAVEIDSLSGRLMKQLYQGSNVEISPFQDVVLPDNFFDVAVGNVPFMDMKPYGTADKDLNKLRFSLHDYYFAKSLKKIRPGGVLAFVTSRYTMDKASPTVRKYLSSQADLLGAIRLPNTAFKGIAATEVTTDIVFLQKRLPETPAKGHEWEAAIERDLPTKEGGTGQAKINEYFVRNPHMMLGRMSLTGSMYRSAEPTLEGDGRNLRQAIEEAIQSFPEQAIPQHVAPRSTTQESSLERLPAPGDVKESAYVVKDDALYIKVGAELVPQEGVPATKIERIKGHITVRDAVREVLRTQLADAEESEINAARKALNVAYDAFVKKFGYFNTSANRQAYQTDPDYHVTASLEKWDERKKTATKEAIFSQRTIQPRPVIETAASGKEALLASLNRHGVLDLDYMAKISGRSQTALIEELGDLIYENPEGTWEHKEEYLSGNVKRKLKAAKIAAQADPRFNRNVTSLEAVIPADLLPTDISVVLGASWIPVHDVKKFIQESLGIHQLPPLSYIEALGLWQVGQMPRGNFQEWATPRRSVEEILEATLNLQALTVSKPKDEGGGTDRDATIAVQGKQAKWKEAFEEWVWKDPERAVRLAKKYNDESNHTVLRKYDGSHLTLPGSNVEIALRPHQKDSIWRILQTGNTLLAHEVGTGKTFTMIGAAMESRRIGLAKKPVMAVLKATLNQFRDEFLRLYPGANLLVPSAKDFHKDRRKQLIAKIATGDWDAIMITHEQLSRIPVSKETTKNFLEEQIDVLENFIQREEEEGEDVYSKSNRRKRKTVKELEKAKARLEERLKKALDSPADDGLTFEESGIDMLLVDEADQFKNLFFPTRMTRVSGLATTDTARSADLYMKTRYLSKLNNGRNIVFATGTPISNTLAEAFTMQRYLQQDVLNANGMEHFDAWARSFATTKVEVELSPAGKWRQATTFSKFLNVPEMMTMFGNVIDIKFAADLGLKIPPLRTGAPINIAVEPSEALKAYMETIVKRAENMPADSTIDNPLKLSGDSRHAALDVRLRVPDAPDDPKGKVNVAIANIAEEYKRWEAHKGTQLVFLDLSTPKGREIGPIKETDEDSDASTNDIETADEAHSRESVYADIRKKLIFSGIPGNQIAFIHEAKTDAQRLGILRRMNDGDIRVLIGTTGKLGVGVNVNHRLVALHNLDAPWRPRDIEQREGRIRRQGNLLLETVKDFEIAIYNYATKAPSFDVRMWQTLERKGRLISQAMHYDPTVREVEDVGVGVMTAAEMKAVASGNPLIFEKVALDNEIMKLKSLKRAHDNEAFGIKQRLAEKMNAVSYHEGYAPQYKALAEYMRAHGYGDEGFKITLGEKEFVERKEAWAEIAKISEQISGNEGTPQPNYLIGKFYDANLYMDFPRKGPLTDDLYVSLMLEPGAGLPSIIGTSHTAGRGAFQSLEAAIKKDVGLAAYHEQAKKEAEQDVEILKQKIDTPFKDAERLVRAKKRQTEIETALQKDEPIQVGGENRQDDDEGPDDGGGGLGAPIRRGDGPEGPDAFGMPRKGWRKYAGPTPRIQPEPIYGQTPKKLREILAEASKSLDQKIWRGKLPKRFGGMYFPKNKAVLLKHANDLDTAAHELAHALDRRFNLLGPPHMRNAFNFELSKFWQHGSVTKSGKRAKLAYRQAEGVAEWLRAYLVNPQATQQAAPGFTKFALGRIPDTVQEGLEAFGKEIRVFAGAAGLEQVKSNIHTPGPLPPIAKIRDIFKTPDSPGFQLRWIDRMAAKWTDDMAPVLRAFEWARKQRGEEDTKILPKDDVRIMARLFMGINSQVDDAVQFGVPVAGKPADVRGTEGGATWLLEPLNHDSIEELEQEKLNVAAYMIAQRTLEKAEQFGRDAHISGIGGGITSDVDVAKRAIAKIHEDPEKRKRYDDAVKRYRQWADANLRYLVDHGRMSEEQYQDIKDANEYYVAMHRIVEVTPDEEIVVMVPRSGGSRKVGAPKKVVKNFKGSDLTIKDPYAALLDLTNQSLREADRNHVLRSFIDVLDLDSSAVTTTGPDIDLASVGRKAQEGEKQTIAVYRDGKKEVWQFHPEVYRALKGLVDGQVKLHWVFTGLPSLLRSTIVYAPTFAAKNAIRDAFHRAVLSRSNSKPWDSLKRYDAMEFSALKRHGGDQAGHYYTDENQYNRAMKAAMEELVKQKHNTVVIAAHKVGHGYKELMQLSERQGRVAEYRRAYQQATTEGVDLGDGKKVVLDPYNAGLWASAEARALIDYAVAGEHMRWINQVVVFSNAAVQGVRVYARAIKDRPKKILAGTMAWAAIPALMVYAWNAMNDDLEEFRQLPAWRRDLFYNFKLGPDMWGAIPKSFEIGLVSSSIERFIDYLNGNQRAFEGHVGQFIETMLPVDTAGLAGPLQGIVQATANWDFFRQKHIVPVFEEGLELPLRKTWRASRLGQVIQDITGIDARKIDFLAKQQFGYFGQYATRISDIGRPERQALGLADTGFIRTSPAAFALDTSWVDKKAKERGAVATKEYKRFRAFINDYYDAKTPTARDRMARIVRREARMLRKKWERTPPRPDAEQKLEKKRMAERR